MRSRASATIAAAIAISGLTAAAADAQPLVGQPGRLAVGVLYEHRPCGNAPGRLVQPAPVTAGTLELKRRGHALVRLALGARPAQVTLPGSGPVTGTLVLSTRQVQVVVGAGNASAQRIALGIRSPKNGHLSYAVSDAEDSGHVNVLIELDADGRFAAHATPKAPPQVTARVFGGAPASRRGTGFGAPVTINVGQHNGVDDQWEADALAHEYGHFLLEQIARPDPAAGGVHSISQSYPAKPGLAWSEGFPTAFSAVSHPSWQGVITEDCGKPRQNLVSQPARPQLDSARDKRYAQYNETRVAAVTYGLIEQWGGGWPGLRRLLRALSAYHRGGHSVWTARDLRDLAVAEFERTQVDQTTIDHIFLGQGMVWHQGFRVSFDPGTNPYGQSANAELVISVTGPGGFDCRNNTGGDLAPSQSVVGLAAIGVKAADGGLGFAGEDDCYLISGDGRVTDPYDSHGFGGDGVDMPFPYLAGLTHWQGEFKVSATYVCKFDQRAGPPENFSCPSVVTFQVRIDSPVLLATDPSLLNPTKVALSEGVDKVIAAFSAVGKCEIYGVGATTDCGF